MGTSNRLDRNLHSAQYELVQPTVSIPFAEPAKLYFVHRTHRIHWNHGDSGRHGGLTFPFSI